VDVKSLTRAADLALYAGKAAGRGHAVRYQPEMLAKVDERRVLERDLRNALERGEIQIAYQGIVDAVSENTVAYEALLRWEHPTLGAISPARFIPSAEEAGLINQIGDWVLKTACREAASWSDSIYLAVNLSAIQVASNGLAANVVNALAASGLPAHRLELEVTESVFLGDDGKSEEALEHIRSLGVKLALDDFGTGFSSLGYLRRATFSTIKIDRSFVKSASQNSQNSIAIIRAIVALASDLNMKTTAEGIESAAELATVRALGCTLAQGYLFSMPTFAPSGETDARRAA
jgi:EAL domain-containing protein (putative c-di-GMP-specific phosphodiesterase class I)